MKLSILLFHLLASIIINFSFAILIHYLITNDSPDSTNQLLSYDPCVANRRMNMKQHTITWHVDDIKSSHEDTKVNDQFEKWLQKTYGEDGIGKVKSSRGKRHDYLAIILDFSTPGVLGLDMTDHVKRIIKDFEYELGEETQPWNDKLFRVDETSKRLDDERSSVFHTFTMKLMFVSKQARQDIQPGVAFLATRTGCSTEQDWNKLVRILSFLKKTQNQIMRLEADDTQTLKWYVDAAFAVHPDYKSHTGAILTLGKGAVTSVSTKQKVNTRSSTESELVGVDDVVAKILWTKQFMEAQGFKVKLNIVYRDNTSSMKLEQNGKSSSGKRTRHFNNKYFYITDLIKRNEMKIEYCPTDKMWADYMTKPLMGSKFKSFWKWIMNSE